MGSGSAPVNSDATSPSLKSFTAGMPWMPNSLASDGLSSTLTLASTNSPAYSSASFSSTGPRTRQGPHHGAQKSTRMGTCRERSRISESKLSSLTSIVDWFMIHTAPYLNSLNDFNLHCTSLTVQTAQVLCNITSRQSLWQSFSPVRLPAAWRKPRFPTLRLRWPRTREPYRGAALPRARVQWLGSRQI